MARQFDACNWRNAFTRHVDKKTTAFLLFRIHRPYNESPVKVTIRRKKPPTPKNPFETVVVNYAGIFSRRTISLMAY